MGLLAVSRLFGCEAVDSRQGNVLVMVWRLFAAFAGLGHVARRMKSDVVEAAPG
jgi:hypothetical protein